MKISVRRKTAFFLSLLLLMQTVTAFGFPEDAVKFRGFDTDSVSLDSVSTDSISGDSISGDSVSADSISGNTVSGDSVSYDGSGEGWTNPGSRARGIFLAPEPDSIVLQSPGEEDAVSGNSVSGNAAEEIGAETTTAAAAAAAGNQPAESKGVVLTAAANLATLMSDYITAKPGKVKIKSVKNPSKGKVTIKWKKVKNAAGYEVCYSTAKGMAKSKTVVLETGKRSLSVTNLAAKTYYIKVRAYAIGSNGNRVYGAYSAKKKVAVTKGVAEVSVSKDAAVIQKTLIGTSSDFPGQETVNVRAKVKKRVASSDEFYYLFAQDGFQTNLKKQKPVAKLPKKKTMNFSVLLSDDTADSLLQKKFTLAVKSGSRYKAISSSRYITNPQKTAKVSYAYPEVGTKKGLQFNATMMADVKELGVKRVAYNFILSDFFASEGEKNENDSLSYEYQGQTYWFKKSVVRGYDGLFIQTRDMGIVATGILLVGYRPQQPELIYPGARVPGHNYYMFNTKEKKGRRSLEAVCTFLAERYSTNRYVTGWVVGNEVNAHQDWNYAGSLSKSQYVKAYSDMYRMVNTCMKSVYGNARVYMSLDNHWTAEENGIYGGRSLLASLKKKLKAEGDVHFDLAYHPYSYPMTSLAAWDPVDVNLVRKSKTSPMITMYNLSYMTKYIRNTYGRDTHILLSEVGFTSYGSEKGEQYQAASIAYAYYKAEADSMVEGLIISRHVDNAVEMQNHLYTGLWHNASGQEELATGRKYAWTIFKYMDTDRGHEVTDYLLPYIGVSSWKSVI